MHPTLFLPVGFQLAALLAIVPFISATPFPSQLSRRVLHRDSDNADQQRDLLPGMLLPGGAWSYLSCVPDSTLTESMLGSVAFNMTYMTIEHCVRHCNNHYDNLAALDGIDCYCGNATANGAEALALTTPGSKCDTVCPGDWYEACGGPFSLTVWWNSQPPE